MLIYIGGFHLAEENFQIEGTMLKLLLVFTKNFVSIHLFLLELPRLTKFDHRSAQK